MAVTLKGQTAVYEGTSTDTKPTDADNNAIFKELDTGIRYYYDGTDWNEIPRSGGGGGGGTGTDNYNDLNNKPSINGTTLSGNKSLDNLGIQAKLTFDSTPTEDSENPVESGGVYSALAGKQDTISDLSTIRRGAAAGATAVQPATLETALAGKQDALSSEQLAAVNSGIDSTKVAQIETNKNNISKDEVALVELVDGGAKNFLNLAEPTTINRMTITDVGGGSITASCSNATWASSNYEFSVTAEKTYKFIIYVDSANVSNVQFQCFVNDISGGTAQELGRTSRITSSGIYSIDFVATSKIRAAINLNNSNTAATGSATYHAMLCTKAEWKISQAYQPYCPSYQELYEMVKALQANQ